jgi:hypothetical protein
LGFASLGDVIGPEGWSAIQGTGESADPYVRSFIQGVVPGLAGVNTLFADGVCVKQRSRALAVRLAFFGVVITKGPCCAVPRSHAGPCGNVSEQSDWQSRAVRVCHTSPVVLRVP